MTRERTLIAPVKQQVEKKKRARDSALSVKMYGTSVVRQPRVDTNVNCRDLQPCGDIYSSDFTPFLSLELWCLVARFCLDREMNCILIFTS